MIPIIVDLHLGKEEGCQLVLPQYKEHVPDTFQVKGDDEEIHDAILVRSEENGNK